MWFLQKLSHNHEIFHAKTAVQDLFRTFFRYVDSLMSKRRDTLKMGMFTQLLRSNSDPSPPTGIGHFGLVSRRHVLLGRLDKLVL